VVFENLGWPELVLLILVGLFIFGPDKLPKAISDGLKFVRNLRAMASNATADLSREIGTDIKLEDLHPKSFIRKHVLSEEDQSLFRNQAEDLRRGFSDALADPRQPPQPRAAAALPAGEPVTAAAQAQDRPPRQFDLDAT
jgi:sec-independent protein translocase protein TatB